METRTLPVDICVFGRFGRLSPAAVHSPDWSAVSKCGTHFEDSFLIDKYSFKMVHTLPFDIFNSSAISRNFNLQSAKTSLWSFLCFPGQLLNLGNLSIQHHLCLYNHIKSQHITS